jgi:hypothetical protein
MKVKKLKAMLDKLPDNMELFYFNGDFYEELGNDLDVRSGAAILGPSGEAGDESDPMFNYPYSKKAALEELKNVDRGDLDVIRESLGLVSVDEVEKHLKKNEDDLKKVARDFFSMG